MSFITVKHTAEAAKAIYKNNDFPGFTQLGGFFDPKNDDRLGWNKDGDAGGGSAGLYRCNAYADHYILAFRGSKGAKDWKVDDVQIGMNMEVDRASDCLGYARGIQAAYPKAFIMVAGHSLGGFLAQVVGVMCNLPFITYNAPPAGRTLAGNRAAQGFRMGVNIRVNWDPVSRAPGKHIGPLVTLPHVGMKIYDAHTSAAFMKSIERANFRDMGAMSYIFQKNT
jgi:hypothetical protein